MSGNTLDVILFAVFIVAILAIAKWSLWAQDRAYREDDRRRAEIYARYGYSFPKDDDGTET